MKTTALALALTAALALPAAAQQKKAKRAAKPAAPAAQPVDSNEASWRLVKGSLPIFLPSWSMPLYMQMHGNQAYENEQKAQKAARKKRR